jgi:hypothetical protein
MSEMLANRSLNSLGSVCFTAILVVIFTLHSISNSATYSLMFRLQISCILDLGCSGYYLAKVRIMNGTVTMFLDASFPFADL